MTAGSGRGAWGCDGGSAFFGTDRCRAGAGGQPAEAVGPRQLGVPAWAGGGGVTSLDVERAPRGASRQLRDIRRGLRAVERASVRACVRVRACVQPQVLVGSVAAPLSDSDSATSTPPGTPPTNP